jgi:hypothetical protein
MKPLRGQIVNPRVKGVYETEYGNAAVVKSAKAKSAYDLDMGEKIPIELVTHKFLRPVDACDEF